MADDNNELQGTIEQSEEIQMGLADTLTGLIQSTIAADQKAADDYIEMIEAHALEEGENGRQRLKMVDIEMTDSDGNKRVMSIPKLSLMTLPSLRVSEATFELEAELSVTETTEEERQRLAKTYPSFTSPRMGGLRGVPARQLTRSVRGSSETAATGSTTPTATIDSASLALAAGMSIRVKRPVRSSTSPVKTTTSKTTTSEKSTNLKITIKLQPTTLPDGMRGLLQEAQSSITVTNEE